MSTTLPLIRVPEFVIHDGLQKALKFIKAEYEASAAPEESFLYKLCHGAGFQKYDYWEQAKAVFLKSGPNPRELEVDLMFNRKRDHFPSIHIVTPSDSPAQNGLGMDQGYQDDVVKNVNGVTGSTTVRSVFVRRYRGIYDIVINSDNSNEAIMIFHIVRALLTSLFFHFEANGLENISFSGNDLTPYAELIPNPSFLRIVRMTVEYETGTMSFETSKIVADTVFEGTATTTITDDSSTTTTTTTP